MPATFWIYPQASEIIPCIDSLGMELAPHPPQIAEYNLTYDTKPIYV